VQNIKMQINKFLVLGSLCFNLATPISLALPIGFGVNQGDHEYSELKSSNFYIYHDKRTPDEAAVFLNSLEAARPLMDQWFGQKRNKILPVITSAISSNASFANVITDVIELQSRGQGTRDLAWHEYAHTKMYGNLRNFLGPSGTLIPLFFMPAWFLEGLAETISVSIGMDSQMGVERYQALTGDWPSYERLHSLYRSEFSARGYATAGAFTTWILRQGNPNDLPKLLNDFYDYSLPHWWPWSVIPFNGFLPMDAALEDYSDRDGRELWRDYKIAAKAYWTKSSQGHFYAGEKNQKRSFGGFWGLTSYGKDFVSIVNISGALWRVKLTIDPSTNWVTGYKKLFKISPFAGEVESDLAGNQMSHIVSADDNNSTEQKAAPITRAGVAHNVYKTSTGNIWLETDLSDTRLCFNDKKSIKKIECHITRTQPNSLTIVGVKRNKNNNSEVNEIWLRDSTQTLAGDRHSIIKYDIATGRSSTLQFGDNGRPISIAFADSEIWALTAEHNTRTLRKISPSGKCLSMILVKDHIQNLVGTSNGNLALGIYGGSHKFIKVISPKKMKQSKCYSASPVSSPLLVALQSNQSMDFKTAIIRSNPWAPVSNIYKNTAARALKSAPPLNNASPKGVKVDKESSPAKWRGRHVFLFPWIGGEDSMGPQLGIVSIPVMDHMQNESIRASLLYGLYSQYPNVELAFRSGRFTPDLQFTVFRHQTWNGLFLRKSTGELESAYYDEKGARAELSHAIRIGSSSLSMGLGLKTSYLSPYSGLVYPQVAKGYRTETTGNLGWGTKIGSISWSNSLRARFTLEEWNELFDYNQIGFSSSIGKALPLRSKFSTGIEGSRTRGKKTMLLKEIYRPLKTFVPGSGGGINKTSFALTANRGLFSPTFGDTQGRYKANWTIPVIRNFDSLWYVIYVERLDFTAFYNYGGSWYGDEPSSGWGSLISSHGFNLDLQFDNKGVRFNSGTGIGKVAGNGYQLYMTFGFDALF
jgi:hypothetical protein